MTSTVATEIPQSAEPPKSLLETWGRNERMRHVPPIEWIIGKVEGDLKHRIYVLCSSESRAIAEVELTALCRALDRLADIAKYSRGNHGHNAPDLADRVRDALHHAVTSLYSVDANLF